jgi:hypothetical protein
MNWTWPGVKTSGASASPGLKRLMLDAKQNTESTAEAAIVRFAHDNHIGVLNVAGPA